MREILQKKGMSVYGTEQERLDFLCGSMSFCVYLREDVLYSIPTTSSMHLAV